MSEYLLPNIAEFQDYTLLKQNEDIEYDISEAVEFNSLRSSDFVFANFLNWIFFAAAKKDCSDIHFQDCANGSYIRIRAKDGHLYDFFLISNKDSREINRKIRAKCQISETDTVNAFDGSFTLIEKIENEHGDNYRMGIRVDIRVSMIPNRFKGQNTVCRILQHDNNNLNFSRVHIPSYLAGNLQNSMSKKEGFIYNCGSTGSGKTTTLFTILNTINKPDINILTIEDPPEVYIPRVTQVAVMPPYITFAKALRTFLRQDPDVILIGEIRDQETAEIAIQSSQTGHLVFSTIHATNCLISLSRLVGLGVNIQNTVDAVIAFFSQKLMRKLCPHCRIAVNFNDLDSELQQELRENVRPELIQNNYYLTHHDGCEKCNHCGTNGKVNVMEWVNMTHSLRELILKSKGELDSIAITQEFKQQAQYRTFIEAATLLSNEGLVSVFDAIYIEGIKNV